MHKPAGWYILIISLTIAFMIWRLYDKIKRLYSTSSEYPAVFSYQRFSKLASVYYNKKGFMVSSIWLSFSYDRKLWDLPLHGRWSKIFPFHGLAPTSVLSSVNSQVWAVIIFHENLSLQTSSASWSFLIRSEWCRDMNRTFMPLIMLWNLFRQFPGTSEAECQYGIQNPLQEYLNWRVITSYGIFLSVMNTWCLPKWIWNSDRWLILHRLCFCPAVFGGSWKERFHAERSSEIWSSSKESCLYLMIIKMPSSFIFATADTTVST